MRLKRQLLLLFAFLFLTAAKEESCASAEKAFLEAAQAGNAERVNAFIERGIDLEAKDRFGSTALMRAAEAGHRPIVKLLLDRGANVNVADPNGETVLMAAIRAERIDVVEMLLDRGVKINLFRV